MDNNTNQSNGQVIPTVLQTQIPSPTQLRAESKKINYGEDAIPRAKQLNSTTAPIDTNAQPQTTQPAVAPPTTVMPAGVSAQIVPQQPASAQSPNQDTPLSTQTTLLISEIRDSVVIMKDGSFRAVVACQSINFDLMSNEERDGIEYSYQNFLNSINFTVQILVRSQKVDIRPYINKLTDIRRNSDNMLLGILMDDYIDFIDALAEQANIMDKSFFIIIPYYSSADQEKAATETKNFFTAFGRSSKLNTVTRISRQVYDLALEELDKRVDSVIAGLYQVGIKSVRLDTRGLSALYYNFNNPDTALREPLVDFNSIATTYVTNTPSTPENGAEQNV